MNEKFLNPVPYEYYGDNVRWFIATVIDASPPFGFEGRVKRSEEHNKIYLGHNVFFQQQKVVYLV